MLRSFLIGLVAGQRGITPLAVTAAGARFLTGFGADLRSRGRRIFCRPCLDWSERRYHVAGLVGAAIWRRSWSSAGSRASATPARCD